MVFFVALCSSCDQLSRPVFSEANAQAVSKCSWQGGSSILFVEDQYNKYPCFSLIQKVFIFFPDLYSSYALMLNLGKKITFLVVVICGRTLWFWLLVEGSFSSLDQLSRSQGALSLLSWYVSLCELMWIIISLLRNGPPDMIEIYIFWNSEGPCYHFSFCSYLWSYLEN